MELDAHKDALAAAYDRLGRAGQEHERQAFELHPFNPLHPERWRAFGENARALGGAAIELIKITPHFNEIRKLGKERES
jgi:hypothetical protein